MVEITATNSEDLDLLKKLSASDRIAIKRIYDLALPSVIVWVKENNGTEEDARDVFQEAMIALFRQVSEKKFHLSCRLKSYLRIVCRNLWLSRIRNDKKFQYTDIENLEEIDLQESMVEQIERSEEEQMYFKHFDSLSDKCQRILKWFFDKVAMSEIARRLDSTEQYIKKRKFVCKEKLVDSIKNDPIYNELRHN